MERAAMKVGDAPILLVEDDPDDVRLFWRAIDKAGLTNRLRVVRDGDEAIAYLSGTGAYADRNRCPLPALVLLDLKLPRKSGYEVLEWVRQRSELASVMVVALTSSENPADIQRVYDLGVHSYLVKPSRPEEMAELVKALGWLRFKSVPRRARALPSRIRAAGPVRS
jgi:CheY-like chemotaxis protein